MVSRQQLTQVRHGVCVHPGLGRDRPGVGELPVELSVELGAVGDHDERPPARHPPQHLLAEPQHRQRLARALGMPEDSQALVLLSTRPVQVLDRRVDSEVLVGPSDHLDQATGTLHVSNEVLQQVQQHRRVAGAAQRRLQCDRTAGAVGVDDLPVVEEFEGRVRGADLGHGTVGEHHEAVRDEQLRDGVAVVRQIVVVSRLDRLVWLLELHQYQRDAVDEQHQVQASAVQVALDPHLLHRQQVIARWILEVEEP